MKRNFLAALFFGAIAFVSCSKDGDAGPAGQTGNANVTEYSFGTRTFTGTSDYVINNLTTGHVDSSIVLGYYNPSSEAATAWYPIPGLGSGALYDTRSLFYSTAANTYAFSVRIMNANGTGSYANPVTFTKFRVFLVPATTIIGGRSSSSAANAPVDYSDYNAVCAYYHIQP